LRIAKPAGCPGALFAALFREAAFLVPAWGFLALFVRWLFWALSGSLDFEAFAAMAFLSFALFAGAEAGFFFMSPRLLLRPGRSRGLFSDRALRDLDCQ
jgi:hypothetical protein